MGRLSTTECTYPTYLVEKSVTLRQFMFYASKFICSSLSCIFR